jgi:hypothetical protein
MPQGGSALVDLEDQNIYAPVIHHILYKIMEGSGIDDETIQTPDQDRYL